MTLNKTLLLNLASALLYFSSILLSANEMENMVKIHAPYQQYFSCSEHWQGQFQHVGDALGTDCMIQQWHNNESKNFMSAFISDGQKNEDWFGFKQPVLAPCNCTVERVHVNSIANVPGKINRSRASAIMFQTADGVRIMYAHVRDINVKQGQTVKAGEVVAKVGNNGYSRAPHIHIGAWSKQQPLQIRFDQNTINLFNRTP